MASQTEGGEQQIENGTGGSGPTFQYAEVMAGITPMPDSRNTTPDVRTLDFASSTIPGYDQVANALGNDRVAQMTPKDLQGVLINEAAQRGNGQDVTDIQRQLHDGDIIKLKTPGQPDSYAFVYKGSDGKTYVSDHPTDTSQHMELGEFARKMRPDTKITRFGDVQQVNNEKPFAPFNRKVG